MAEKGTNPDGIHNGHRRRIFNKYLAIGIERLKEYEQLEIMLYPIIPRGDTCYIARNLLERFGSIEAVLDAEHTQLAAVEGVGDGLAAEMCLLSELCKMMNSDCISARMGKVVYNEESDSVYSREWILRDDIESEN